MKIEVHMKKISITHDYQINAGGPHAWSADNYNTKDISNHSNDANTNK